MRRACAAISSVKTGSTFSSSATPQRRAAAAPRGRSSSVSPTRRRPHSASSDAIPRRCRWSPAMISTIACAVVVGLQDPGDAPPGVAVARRQREVEVVEHARRDVHREHRLLRPHAVGLAAERVERLAERQHELGRVVAALADERDELLVLGQGGARRARERLLLGELGRQRDQLAQRLEVARAAGRPPGRGTCRCRARAPRSRRASRRRDPRASAAQRAPGVAALPEPLHHAHSLGAAGASGPARGSRGAVPGVSGRLVGSRHRIGTPRLWLSEGRGSTHPRRSSHRRTGTHHRDDLRRTRRRPGHRRCPRSQGHRRCLPHPGADHPPRPSRPGHHRPGQDGHRQDLRLRHPRRPAPRARPRARRQGPHRRPDP